MKRKNEEINLNDKKKLKSAEPMKRYSSNQRLAQEHEACCVVCGRYGEYVNKDTKQDVCR